MTHLTIGKFAEQAGVTTVTLRFYERNGLIPKSTRSDSGYRLYPADLLPRMRFIHNAKIVGFSLKEIAELFAIQADQGMTSKQIREATVAKLDAVKEKIFVLKKMQKALTTLVDSCDGKVPLEQCPILENLYK